MNGKVCQMLRGTALAPLVLMCLGAELAAQTNRITVSPPPDWVRPGEWSAPVRPAGNAKSEGTRFLLYERQDHAQCQEHYTRAVELMENETGVQDSGSLTFGFDPSFEELILHRIQIHRAGKGLERLDPSKIKLIQPEPGLEGHIFTGEQTALLFVEDLRVGDALESAWTIRGANPVFGGHYAARFVVQSRVPVDHRRIRIVWPWAKPLHLRQHLAEVAPRQAPWNEGTEYGWDFSNLEAIPLEDDLPASYEPYPYVELSDFDDWARVVEWALPLYATGSSNMPPDLREMISKWQRVPSKEEQALLALQFVQDELRYTGIELGPDSYRPAHPFETFRLRYGDCKGKASLLCAILRELNIEAYPALVSTSSQEAVARRLPSPFAFNHVIVKLVLEGRTVWVDPTCSHQGGPLRGRFVRQLGKALVVKPGVKSFEDIPPPAAGTALQRITSTFELGDYQSPASLTVTTSYHGSEADNMREFFARKDAKDVGKEYLNFYAGYYPGIREPRPLGVEDNRTGNVLTVTERYRVGDLWAQEKSGDRWEATFYAEGLEKMLRVPETRLRKMPLRVPYPLRREQEVVVHLPDDDWNISGMEQKVEHDAFSFHYRRTFSGSTVRFTYDCETRAPEIPAGNVADYLKKLGQMQDLLGDTLFRPQHGSRTLLARLNWLMVTITGFGLGATLLGGLWVWYLTRPRSGGSTALPPVIGERHLQGLGGWLILIGFGLCIGPVWRCVSVAQNWEGYFSIHSWQAAAVPSGELYHPLYGPLLIFEVLGNVLMFGSNILVACLFFARRRAFPWAYIALLTLNVAFLLLDEVLGRLIPSVAADPDASSIRYLRNAILYGMLWSLYMLKSKRVKATFVR